MIVAMKMASSRHDCGVTSSGRGEKAMAKPATKMIAHFAIATLRAAARAKSADAVSAVLSAIDCICVLCAFWFFVAKLLADKTRIWSLVPQRAEVDHFSVPNFSVEIR
jgi:hypothetical protein